VVDQKAHVYNTGADQYSVTVGNDGGNGEGIRNQFVNSDPDSLRPMIDALGRTVNYSKEVESRLASILDELNMAWQGDLAQNAVDAIALLQKDAGVVTDKAGVVQGVLDSFRDSWANLRRLAGTLDDDDDERARRYFHMFATVHNDALNGLPSKITYYSPMSDKTGTGGFGGVDTNIPKPDYPKPPAYTPPPPFHIGAGAGDTHAGLGAGFDPSTSLAGLGGGGADVGGLGGASGAGFHGGGAGAGAGAGLGGGIGAAGAGAGGAAGGGSGAGGFLPPPMTGSGGAGGNESEHERTTWLEEDEDVWGGGEGQAGLIS
jgi:hypothetical protein